MKKESVIGTIERIDRLIAECKQIQAELNKKLEEVDDGNRDDGELER